MTDMIEVKVPDIGDFAEVDVIEVHVKAGDTVAPDDTLLTLESDKAAMDVPTTVGGVVAEVLVAEGDKVSEGTVIVRLQAVSGTKPAAAAEVRSGGASGAAAATGGSGVVEVPAAPPAAAAIPAGGYTGKVDAETGLLVLGAGPGGYTAAFRAADLGLEVTLVDRWPTLGGVCLNVGCIPSKALLHAAKVIEEAEAMADCGVSFGKPQIDIAKLRGWKQGVVNRLTGGLTALAKQRKVNVVQGTGRFLSPHHVEVEHDGTAQVIAFRQCIIAAGSELTNALVPGCDPDLVRPLEKRIKGRYEAIMKGIGVTSVKAQADGLLVSFEGKDAPEPQLYDKVLVAVGRAANGSKIGADKAGVAVSERGIISVDKQMRTNAPHIFAIGDIVGQPMLAHKAVHEGKVAAEVCAGEKSFFDARVIPGVAYTDPEIAWVGVTETEAKAQGIAYETGKFPWAASGRSLSVGRDEGMTKLIIDKHSHKVIGAGIVGPNAGELIAEAGLAIEMGCDAADIGLTVHAHPTLSETVAMAAEAWEGTLTDLYKPLPDAATAVAAAA